jgi:dihydroneopterin aldolase
MSVTTKTIIVRDQQLVLSVGVHAHEKEAPQRLLVSVEVEMDGASNENDQLSATLDYDQIHGFVKAQEKEAHSELQETIARRILDFVLSKDGVIAATVQTEKPDVFDDCAYVGVRLTGKR